jgi:hypothetical protein
LTLPNEALPLPKKMAQFILKPWQPSISLGGADNEKIWDLANRGNVWLGCAGLRQQGRGKSQTGDAAGAG